MSTADRNQRHKSGVQIPFIVGSLLSIIGCFLPWVGRGDPGFYTTAGISIRQNVSIDPLLRSIPFDVSDNGGFVIILISMTLLVIAYSGYPWIYHRQLILLLSIGAVALTLFHISSVLVLSIEWRNITGQPQLMYGLPIVLVGSCILLVTSIRFVLRQ